MKALVVVDYQNDFVNGSLGFAGAELLEPIIVEDYLQTAEGGKLPIKHCIEGTNGHDLYGKVAECILEDDILITKGTFGSLELANLLKNMNFKEVELCGLVTDICVVSNAIIAKAALPESRVIVDSRACASFDNEKHKAALEVMKSVQIDVV